MAYNDPDNLRLDAAKKLNDVLVSSKTSTGGKPADKVAVVDFSSEGDDRLLYPLGDPSGADAAIDQVNVRDNTFIGGGIIVATKEITKAGSGDTKGKSALVVLTDGVDNTDDEVNQTIQSIVDAGKQGIRVHFGFLDLTADSQDPRLTSAILNTNGFFSTIATADDIEKFVASVLAKGLTDGDNKASNGGTLLLPQLTASSQLSASGPTTFQYSAKSGEAINITVTAITSGLDLKETLKDGSGKEISSQQTNSSGIAFTDYTSTSDQDLTIEVTGTSASASGLFSIEVQSVLACGGLSNTTVTNTTIPPQTNTTSNNTVSPTPTPPPYISAGDSLHARAGGFAFAWAIGFVVAAAAALL